MNTKLMKTTGLLAGLLASASAAAHSGHHGGEWTSSLDAGLLHPLTGADHLLVLLVLGLWACRGGGSLRPAGVFLGTLLAGSGLAVAGVSLPATETFVAASVLLAGLMLARQRRKELLASAAFGAMGLFHGQAHMTDVASQAEPLLFALGLFTVSVAVIAASHQVGIALRESARSVAGYATAAAGALMLLGA
ncbi:MAG: HupE/UreJ family protein [Xanthomonadales bacterium]|nr:HupE/UreJ family protein [Xanthomonadales bacterium]